MRRAIQRHSMALAGLLGLGVLLALPGIEAIRWAPAAASTASGSAPAPARASAPALAASFEEAASGATVTTDKPDYFPGQVVTISGSGWQAAELVTMVLHEEPTIDPDLTLYATADETGQ